MLDVDPMSVYYWAKDVADGATLIQRSLMEIDIYIYIGQ